MSKINDLIKKLCPNGVFYYAIKELCVITRGRVISKNELKENIGEYPVYSSQTLNNGVFGKINTYDFDGEFVQWTTDGANAGSVFYRNGKFSVTNVCGLLKVKDEYKTKVNTNFLSYILDSVSKKYVNYATSNPKLMSNVVEKIRVAVPPIEIQEEIVRILGKFDCLEAELEIELEAELEARKSQYDFWRAKLVNNGRNVYKYRLNELVDFTNGKGHEKVVNENGKYILITSKAISTNLKKVRRTDSMLSPLYVDDIVMVMSDLPNGRALAKCYLIEEDNKYTLNQRICRLHLKKNIDNVVVKYLYYKLDRNCDLLSYDNKVDQTNLRKQDILNLELNIPSVEEQQCIVNILDKFEKLTDDISVSLLAEIELRKKQYEYYKNKLLSFEEVRVND